MPRANGTVLPCVALFGYPLSHSVSPAMHAAAALELGIALDYRPVPLPPEDLARVIHGLREEHWLGANVTLPHKPAVLALVDQVTPLAARIGAVNTVYKRDGRLLGDNTDAPAFEMCLQAQLGFQPEHERVLVLGAGGAARAALVALLDAGVPSVSLWNRTATRAAGLLDELAGRGVPTNRVHVVSGETPRRELAEATLLVNTTSVGLDGASLPIASLDGLGDARIFDMVYGEDTTPLVRLALASGRQAVDGLWMLARQAAASFALWTGQQPSEEVMHAAALQALAARSASRRES